MRILIRKIHMYVGLLNFCALVVFGIAGLTATFDGPLAERAEEASVRYVSFQAGPHFSDVQVANQVYDTLQLPLTNPIPEWAIHRNAQNLLELNFYTVNGVRRVTVLEEEGRLRIETLSPGIWQFFNDIHTVTGSGRQADLRLRLWALYNEFAIWSLTGMSLSGLYLWLASRPGHRWAQYSLAAGCALFVALYLFSS